MNVCTSREGEPLDRVQLEKDISNIYGLELFETIDYTVSRKAARPVCWWMPVHVPGGRITCSSALALSSDFGGESSYDFGVAYLKTAINELGGEVRLGVQLGQDPRCGGRLVSAAGLRLTLLF